MVIGVQVPGRYREVAAWLCPNPIRASSWISAYAARGTASAQRNASAIARRDRKITAKRGIASDLIGWMTSGRRNTAEGNGASGFERAWRRRMIPTTRSATRGFALADLAS